MNCSHQIATEKAVDTGAVTPPNHFSCSLKPR